MWRIEKPNLKDSLSDVDRLQKDNVVDEKDAGALKELVRQYDLQRGTVTDSQLSTVSTTGAKAVRKRYDYTYNGQTYHYIRKALLDATWKCPYCGIGMPDTLDHFMPKEDYKALSLCRQNLVPACGGCNRVKNDKPYSGFIHPYYTQFPDGEVFLHADIRVVDKRLVLSFRGEMPGSPERNIPFSTHLQNLELAERLRKAAVDFIHSELLSDAFPPTDIPIYLENLLPQKIEQYGLNDWRTAIVRELIKAMSEKSRKKEILGALSNEVKQRKDFPA